MPSLFFLSVFFLAPSSEMKSFLSKVFHGRHVAEATSSVQHEEEVAPVTGEHQEEGAVGQDAPTTEPGSPVVPAVGPAPAAPGQPLIIPPRFVPAPVPARELNPVHKCRICGCHYYAAQNNHLACSHHPGRFSSLGPFLLYRYLVSIRKARLTTSAKYRWNHR